MNTAAWIPDLFMKRVREGGEWTLFSPDEVPELHETYGAAFAETYREYEQLADEGELRQYERVDAQDLWRKTLTRLFETGHPWVTFKDPCNVRSPQDHEGVVHSSNLCTEITLNTSQDEHAVCNLGSVNLETHIDDGRLEREYLADTIETAMRMLDNVIDLCFYPTEEAAASNERHRPIGLGVLGFHEALMATDTPMASEDALERANRWQEFVSYHALLNSSRLAKERGAYPSYEARSGIAACSHRTPSTSSRRNAASRFRPTERKLSTGTLSASTSRNTACAIRIRWRLRRRRRFRRSTGRRPLSSPSTRISTSNRT